MTWLAENSAARGMRTDAPNVQMLTVDVDSSSDAMNAASWAAAKAAQRGVTLAIASEAPAGAPSSSTHSGTCAQCRLEERSAMLDRIAAAVRFQYPDLTVETMQRG
jgi:hypothetical protein